MKFVKNVLGTFSKDMILVVLSLASGIITARLLGPSERGVLALLSSYPALVTAFTFFGINQANIYLIGRKKISATDVASNSMIYAIVIGCSLVGLSYLFKDVVLSTILKGVQPRYFIVVILVFPFVFIDTFNQSVLRALGHFNTINIRIIIIKVLSVLGVVLCLLVIKSGLMSLLIYNLFIGCFSAFLFLFALRKFIPVKWVFKKKLLKPTLEYGMKAYVNSILIHLHMKIDIYFLAYFLTTAQVAFYDISVVIAEVLLFLPTAVGAVLFPNLTKIEKNEAVQFTSQVCRITTSISILGAIFFLVSGHFLIELAYGEEYLPAFLPLVFLLPGVLGICVRYAPSFYFASIGEQSILISSTLAGLSLNVVLNIVFIPRYGIIGAAIATSISYPLCALILLVKYFRDTRESFLNVVIINKSDIEQIVMTCKKLLKPTKPTIGKLT